MSHASGEVIVDNKVVGYFEYNGTCGFACPNIYATMEEMSEYWREQPVKSCECSNQEKRIHEVVLWSSYGVGFHWKARVCFKCMVIVSHTERSAHWDGNNDETSLNDVTMGEYNCTDLSGHPFNVWYAVDANTAHPERIAWHKAFEDIKDLPKEERQKFKIRKLNKLTGEFDDSEPW